MLQENFWRAYAKECIFGEVATLYTISYHQPLSAPPENITKVELFCFQEVIEMDQRYEMGQT